MGKGHECFTQATGRHIRVQGGVAQVQQHTARVLGVASLPAEAFAHTGPSTTRCVLTF